MQPRVYGRVSTISAPDSVRCARAKWIPGGWEFPLDPSKECKLGVPRHGAKVQAKRAGGDFIYWLTKEVVVKWTLVQTSTGDGMTERFVMDLKSSFERSVCFERARTASPDQRFPLDGT